MIKVCRWCKEEFETNIPNKLYCSDKHRREANLESKRKYRKKHYNQTKQESILSQIGTTTISPCSKLNNISYLGVTIFQEFKEELRLIQKEKFRTFSTTRGKCKGNKNHWIDYEGRMEYGKSQPLGIQNTHNYASFDDYVYTGRYYAMKDRKPCPECHSTEAIKDVQHCIISCRTCGLILEVTPSMVAPVSKEAQLCTTIIEKGKGNRKDKKKIDTTTLKKLSFKAYWMQWK